MKHINVYELKRKGTREVQQADKLLFAVSVQLYTSLGTYELVDASYPFPLIYSDARLI